MLATVAGPAIALWAAVNARTARRFAKEARRDAVRREHKIHQLSDLLLELQTLRIFLARDDYEMISVRATDLRGRIARYKVQSYNLFAEDTMSGLDLARQQLEAINRIATSWWGKPENRKSRLQNALAAITESLNEVLSLHQKIPESGDV